MQNFDNIEESSLGNFDDGTFDAFAGKPGQATMSAASFDLTFTNVSGEKIQVELFSQLNTFTKKLRPELVLGGSAITMIPQTSFEGLALAGVGIVGFDKSGSLILTGAGAARELTVSCPQLSYNSLLEASGKKKFKITGIRMTVQNDAQIDNEIKIFTSNFLGGKSENSINPRTSFRPDQFQGKIVDIPANWDINGDTGLLYSVNAGETVKWAVTIQRYS